jgi:hypothetical protein
MRLSFETKENVSVEDFIKGIIEHTPKGTSVFGGNSMPDGMQTSDLSGAQFFNGERLKGHIVAMGIGAPIKVIGNHTNEFPSLMKLLLLRNQTTSR